MSTIRAYIAHNPYISQYIATRIYHELRHQNMSVFMVLEDRSFTTPPSNPVYDSWIKSCDVLIPILTPSIFTRPYANDEWFWRELEMAVQNNISIVSVCAYGFNFPLNPPWQAALIRNLQQGAFVGLTDTDVKDSLRKLVTKIRDCTRSTETEARNLPQSTRYAELLLEQLEQTPSAPDEFLTAEKLVNHATIVANFGDYAADEEECTQALALHPNYVNARLNRASAHALQGHFQEAFDDVNWCIENDRKNFRHYNNRGNIYTMTRNFDMALLDFSKAIDLNPRSDYQHNNRGFTRYQIGDYTGAVQDCSMAIEINPKSFDAYDSRGLAYYCLGDYENALADFEKVQDIRPELFESLAGLAITQFALDNVPAARSAWENMLAILGINDLEFLQKRFVWNAKVYEAVQKLADFIDSLP